MRAGTRRVGEAGECSNSVYQLRSAAVHTQRGTHLSPQSLDRTPFPPNNKDNIADMTSFLTGPHTEHKPGNLVSKAVCCRHHQTVGRSGCLACAQLPAPCPTSCHFTHTCSSDYGSSWRPCPCTTASAMPSGHSVLQVGNVLHSLFSVSHLKIAAAGVPRYCNFTCRRSSNTQQYSHRNHERFVREREAISCLCLVAPRSPFHLAPCPR
jgi:hypothetical protein